MTFDLAQPPFSSPRPVPSFVRTSDLPSSPNSLSSLSSLSPSPPHAPLRIPPSSATLTRRASRAGSKPSGRRRDSSEAADTATLETTPAIRRILPLGTAGTNTAVFDVDGPAREKAAKAGQRTSGVLLLPQPLAQPRPASDLVFPSPGIVLHPDDANSKVFIAMGKAFMSVVSRLRPFRLQKWGMGRAVPCPRARVAARFDFQFSGHIFPTRRLSCHLFSCIPIWSIPGRVSNADN